MVCGRTIFTLKLHLQLYGTVINDLTAIDISNQDTMDCLKQLNFKIAKVQHQTCLASDQMVSSEHKPPTSPGLTAGHHVLSPAHSLVWWRKPSQFVALA